MAHCEATVPVPGYWYSGDDDDFLLGRPGKPVALQKGGERASSAPRHAWRAAGGASPLRTTSDLRPAHGTSQHWPEYWVDSLRTRCQCSCSRRRTPSPSSGYGRWRRPLSADSWRRSHSPPRNSSVADILRDSSASRGDDPFPERRALHWPRPAKHSQHYHWDIYSPSPSAMRHRRPAVWSAGDFKRRLYEARQRGRFAEKAVLAEVADHNEMLRKLMHIPVTEMVTHIHCMHMLQIPTQDPHVEPNVSISTMSAGEAIRFFGPRGRGGAAHRGAVCVLNFANGTYHHVGGGYRNGVMAQEEELCRQIPALAASLLQAKNDGFYPFGPSTCSHPSSPARYSDVLFTQGLELVRSSERDGYEVLPYEERVPVSVISAAAPNIRHGEVNDGGLVYKTIQTIFVAPWLRQRGERIRTLILGAWGTGPFGGDPVRMAHLFALALRHDNLGSFYREVHFAIPGRDPNGAEAVFRDVLQESGLRVRHVDPLAPSVERPVSGPSMAPAAPLQAPSAAPAGTPDHAPASPPGSSAAAAEGNAVRGSPSGQRLESPPRPPSAGYGPPKPGAAVPHAQAPILEILMRLTQKLVNSGLTPRQLFTGIELLMDRILPYDDFERVLRTVDPQLTAREFRCLFREFETSGNDGIDVREFILALEALHGNMGPR